MQHKSIRMYACPTLNQCKIHEVFAFGIRDPTRYKYKINQNKTRFSKKMSSPLRYMYLGKDTTRAQEHDAKKATKHRQY